MFLHHLISSAIAGRATAKELQETYHQLENIRRGSIRYDLDRIDNISMRLCYENICRLQTNKQLAKYIYRETSPQCFWISQLFQCFCVRSVAFHELIREEYLSLRHDLSTLIDKYQIQLEESFMTLIGTPDLITDPIELGILFIYGCQREYKSCTFRQTLKSIYPKIVEFARKGKYSLKMLRHMAFASRRFFPRLDWQVEVQVGLTTFYFHHLLLEGQCGFFRGKTDETRFFHFPDLDPRAFRLFHEFIEYNRRPDFRTVGNKELLSCLRKLKLSRETFQ